MGRKIKLCTQFHNVKMRRLGHWLEIYENRVILPDETNKQMLQPRKRHNNKFYMKEDHRSYSDATFACSCEKKAWKNSGLYELLGYKPVKGWWWVLNIWKSYMRTVGWKILWKKIIRSLLLMLQARSHNALYEKYSTVLPYFNLVPKVSLHCLSVWLFLYFFMMLQHHGNYVIEIQYQHLHYS